MLLTSPEGTSQRVTAVRAEVLPATGAGRVTTTAPRVAPTSDIMRRHVRDLLERIDLAENLRRRAVQEAISDALASNWTRRAEAFEAALPQPGDYPGGPADWETGTSMDPPPPVRTGEGARASAIACRQKAALLEARWLDG